MAKILNRIELIPGSALAWADRLKVGLLQSVAVTTIVGPLTGAVVQNPGTSYETIPTVAAVHVGDDAVLAASMGAETYSVAAAGSGYAPNDDVTLTGGTAAQQAIIEVQSTKLVSAAVNAAGTVYATGDTIALAGGTFTTPAVLTVATTKLISAALNAAGTGYVVADTVTLAGGTASTKAIVTVATIKLVSGAVNAAGADYAVNDTITLAGGTSTTKAVLTVLTVSGGAVATFSISNAGNYTVGSADLTQDSTSGAGTGFTLQTGVFGLRSFTVSTAGSYTVNSATFTQFATSGAGTGATFQTGVFGVLTFNISTAGVYQANTTSFTQSATSGSGTGFTANTGLYGINAISLRNAGIYSVLASNPLDQGSTTGSGSGATINLLTYSIARIAVSDGGDDYANGYALTITGGGGTGGAAIGTTGAVDDAVTLQVTGLAPMPNSYAVFAMPDGPALVAVSGKTNSSFLVTLTPLAGAALAVSVVDIVVIG